MEILFLFIPKFAALTEIEMKIFTTWNGLLMLISVLHLACFGILAAVISAKLIIGEYGGKSAAVIFCYPVKRNKILNAKCIAMCAFITISSFLSNTAVLSVGIIFSRNFGLEISGSIADIIFKALCTGLSVGVLSSAAGIISVTIGQKIRSVPAAVVSSLIICFVPAQCFADTYQSYDNLPVTEGICAVIAAAAIFAYVILKKDIEKLEV